MPGAISGRDPLYTVSVLVKHPAAPPGPQIATLGSASHTIFAWAAQARAGIRASVLGGSTALPSARGITSRMVDGSRGQGHPRAVLTALSGTLRTLMALRKITAIGVGSSALRRPPG